MIEAESYLSAAKRLLTEAERAEVVDMIAVDPSSAGVVVPGTGGLRKMRIGLQGRGKSGGGRVIYWSHLWSKAPDFSRERLQPSRFFG